MFNPGFAVCVAAVPCVEVGDPAALCAPLVGATRPVSTRAQFAGVGEGLRADKFVC